MRDLVSASFHLPAGWMTRLEFTEWLADTVDAWLGDLYESYEIVRFDIDRHDSMEEDIALAADTVISRKLVKTPKIHVYCTVNKPKRIERTYSASAISVAPSSGDVWLSSSGFTGEVRIAMFDKTAADEDGSWLHIGTSLGDAYAAKEKESNASDG